MCTQNFYVQIILGKCTIKQISLLKNVSKSLINFYVIDIYKIPISNYFSKLKQYM